jgi:hypothetical protein
MQFPQIERHFTYVSRMFTIPACLGRFHPQIGRFARDLAASGLHP